jgi:hypothetical protein
MGAVGACARALVPMAPAVGGGPGADLDVSLESRVDPETFRVELDFDGSCNPGTIELEAADNEGKPLTPLSFTADPQDPNVAHVVVPAGTVGEVGFVVSCNDGNVVGEGGETVGAVAVTKVVSGPAPEGATFTVRVACEASMDGGEASTSELPPPPFAVDLTHGASGGLRHVYTPGPIACTITEPDNGGAATTTIDPPTVLVEDPLAYPVTVTNIFPAAAVVAQPNFPG